MDAALILADQILTVIRDSGSSKMEAHAALSIASTTLPTLSDITFRNDLEPEAVERH
jgi:hypothetical protein